MRINVEVDTTVQRRLLVHGNRKLVHFVVAGTFAVVQFEGVFGKLVTQPQLGGDRLEVGIGNVDTVDGAIDASVHFSRVGGHANQQRQGAATCLY